MDRGASAPFDKMPAMTTSSTTDDPKAVLHRYLQHARDAMVWKLDGLSEYDVRRPMTPTGTNLVHMIAETERHAGQADILRETIDGAAGLSSDDDNMPVKDREWWVAYHDRLEETARKFLAQTGS